MPNSCREDRVDKLIHCLKGFHVRIGPGHLGISNLFDDKANKVVAKVLADMGWEIFDSGINL